MISKIRQVNVAGLVAIGLAFVLLVKPAAGNELQKNKDESGWLYELKAGLLAHDVDNLWSRSRKENGVDLNAEIIFGRPHFSLLSGTIRPNLGFSVNNQGDTSKLYAGILWMYETKANVFLNLGIGAAIHNGELETGDDHKKELGARMLFRIPIELGVALNQHHRISILFDHISNAYLASPNEGLDTLGVRYGYRF